MEHENDYLEVDYGKYCKLCKHEKLTEIEEPCYECLENPTNYATDRPVKYETK